MARKLTATEKELARLMSELGSYSYDPYGWVMYAFPWGTGELEGETGPDEWQKDFLIHLRERMHKSVGIGGVIREAVASGHGIGKTTLVSWIILWAMSTLPDTRGVVTANTENQLKTKTWTELAKWLRLCIAKPLFDLGATALRSIIPERDQTWYFNMAPWSEENTEAFAGLHNKHKRLLVVYDEASAISDLIWEVTEGALTDENTEIIWCVFGNPTRNTGRFKECFEGGQFEKRWNTARVDSRTSRFSNKTQLKEWADDYGEDSDFFKVRVKGEFPSASSNQFISVTDARAALDRVLREEQFNFAPKILTCDPAWTGDDDLVIGLRQGLMFRVLLVMSRNDNDIEVATILANHEDNEQADAVFIDQGYGTGIWSAGKTWGRGWQLVNFGSASPDPGCALMRDYIWKKMRDWLKQGGSILKDVKLCAELTAPETVARVDGKIQIESKENMKRRKLRSPNRADALAISFAYPVLQKKTPAFYSGLQVVNQDWDNRDEPRSFWELGDHVNPAKWGK